MMVGAWWVMNRFVDGWQCFIYVIFVVQLCSRVFGNDGAVSRKGAYLLLICWDRILSFINLHISLAYFNFRGIRVGTVLFCRTLDWEKV